MSESQEPYILPLVFEYRNYKGHYSLRNVQPIKIWFGKTEYHPEDQYFLEAYDLDKNNWIRNFALKDIIKFV